MSTTTPEQAPPRVSLLLLVFIAIKWQLWPIPNFVPLSEGLWPWMQSIFLPSLTLAAIFGASYVRLTRAYMLETMSEDYIRTARAKGVKESVVVRRHGLRAALTPIVTAAGLDLGGLLGGAIITEYIFAIPGMGQLFQMSLGPGDIYPVMGYFLVIAVMAITFNFLADLSYAALDPRVRVR